MKHCTRLLSLLMTLLLLGSTAAAFDTSRDSGLLQLVNKAHTLSENYVPELVELSGLPAKGDGRLLRSEAAQALYAMLKAMEADGVTPCNVISTYRSYDYQKKLVDDKVAKRVANGQSRSSAYNQVTMSTAPAGCSEHQLGLAIDFSISSSSSTSFNRTESGKWLSEHAWEYGFILRYQETKTDFTGIVSEPWHYRYVGTPHSYILRLQGWCYEEYISYLQTYGSYALYFNGLLYQIFWTQDTTAEFSNILDISSDNAGGWIITTGAPPLPLTVGHWSENYFFELLQRGVYISRVTDPQATITRAEFARLCGLEEPANPSAPLIRQDAAVLLEKYLRSKTLTYLVFSDLGAIHGSAFQSVQMCVSNGIFSHAEGVSFRPTDRMTWAEAAATALRYIKSLEA